mmetsp:Transcript_38372/g.73704  ORF Transcript_38372/g.73704 Transcript_38372/m.73704 type:complete len:369 (-) Transcript_38372:20-1126(-)
MRTRQFFPCILHGVALLGPTYAKPLTMDFDGNVQAFLQLEQGKGTTSLVQAKNRQGSQTRICIWSAGVNNLVFMYMPFYATLLSGFSAYHDAGSLVIDQRTFNTTGQFAEMGALVEQLELQKGDMFIAIGNVGWEHAPWAAMFNKGVHTVYHQTEPMGPCFPQGGVMVREIWHYSIKNLVKCTNEGKGQDPWPTNRFVPSGFLQGMKQANHTRHWPPPTFLGCAVARPCFDAVQASFNNQIQINYEVWNQLQFDTFIDTPTILIDIPKECDLQAPIATSRMTLVLSAGAHVIAMNSNPDDERLFEGLVTFVPQDQLFEAYEYAASLPPQERTDQAARRVKLFEQRFAPKVLFEQAGVYSLLDNLTARA